MSLSIKHNNDAHQRRNKRVALPVLSVVVDGRVYKTLDWGLGGMQLIDMHGRHRRGQMVEVESLLPFAESDARVPLGLYARVTRYDERRRTLALAFTGLDNRTFEILESLQLQRRLPRRYRVAMDTGLVDDERDAVKKTRAAS